MASAFNNIEPGGEKTDQALDPLSQTPEMNGPGAGGRPETGSVFKQRKNKRGKDVMSNGSLEFILDVPLEIAVELGRTKMLVNDLLKLGQGSVIELTKFAGGRVSIS